MKSERGSPELAGGPDRLHRRRSGFLARFQALRFRDAYGSEIKKGLERDLRSLVLPEFSSDSSGVGDNPTISGDSPMNSPKTHCKTGLFQKEELARAVLAPRLPERGI